MTGKYPVPSNGSFICTFADCPDIDERYKGKWVARFCKHHSGSLCDILRKIGFCKWRFAQ